MDRAELLQQLALKLQKARARREEASAAFDRALTLPAGDRDRGSKLIETSQEYSQALEAVSQALRDYNDAVLHGNKPRIVVGGTMVREELKA